MLYGTKRKNLKFNMALYLLYSDVLDMDMLIHESCRIIKEDISLGWIDEKYIRETEQGLGIIMKYCKRRYEI